MEHRVHVLADPAAAQFYPMNKSSERYRLPSKIELAAGEESPLVQLARRWNGTGKRPTED
jgi:hypothetical protein